MVRSHPKFWKKRIEEAEKKLSKFFYRSDAGDLHGMGERTQGVHLFELDKPKNVYRAKAITELCDLLRNKKCPISVQCRFIQ